MSGDAPDGTVGVPYSFTYSASGDSGITFSATGALPPGLGGLPGGLPGLGGSKLPGLGGLPGLPGFGKKK